MMKWLDKLLAVLAGPQRQPQAIPVRVRPAPSRPIDRALAPRNPQGGRR